MAKTQANAPPVFDVTQTIQFQKIDMSNIK